MILVTVVVICRLEVATAVHIDPDEDQNMASFLAFELIQAVPQSVCANAFAPLNILAMF